MEISADRLQFALKFIKPSEWERFERLASSFLASEWPDIRNMTTASGDGGRDSELFSTTENPNVVIQYSVQEAWKDKISKTITRLETTFPDARNLIYVSNQQIGAKADSLKKDLRKKNIYLDVRDMSWFVERCNLDDNRKAAAAEFARAIVDPLLEAGRVSKQSTSALTGQDARTALLFLEMHWRDESTAKGLTKSSFECLVKSVLQGTSSESRVRRSEIYERVARILPRHATDQLAPHIDAAIRRLTKSAVRHWADDDTFHLSHDETEKLKDRKASVALLVDAFNVDILDLLSTYDTLTSDHSDEIVDLTHRTIGIYFLRQGEKFAAALAHDRSLPLDEQEIKPIVQELAPKKRWLPDRSNIEFLLHVVTTLVASPGDATKEYLRLLGDTYTLFAFLEETPDVQKVAKKLFTHGEIWVDTTVLLPLFAEQSLPETMRPFTSLFTQAKAGKVRFRVTDGILEEIERHINLCVTYTRDSAWNGRLPYVVGRY